MSKKGSSIKNAKRGNGRGNKVGDVRGRYPTKCRMHNNKFGFENKKDMKAFMARTQVKPDAEVSRIYRSDECGLYHMTTQEKA